VRRDFGRALGIAVALTLPTGAAHAGGSLPLTEVLLAAKPYPNLVVQIRLQLVRANLKPENVMCAADRFGTEWTALRGARVGPYTCTIGKRRLSIETVRRYRDKRGAKLAETDPQLPAKAAKVTEAGFKWVWN
jgi:hypothetical protein